MIDWPLERTHSTEWVSFTKFANAPETILAIDDKAVKSAAETLAGFNLIQCPEHVIAIAPLVVGYRAGVAFDPYAKLFAMAVLKELMHLRQPSATAAVTDFMTQLSGPLIDKLLATYQQEIKLGGRASDAGSIQLQENQADLWLTQQGDRLAELFPEENVAKKIMQGLPWIICRVETVANWDRDEQHKAIATLIDALLKNAPLEPAFIKDTIKPIVTQIVNLLWNAAEGSFPRLNSDFPQLENAFARRDDDTQEHASKKQKCVVQ